MGEEQPRRRADNLTDLPQRGVLRRLFERTILTWRLFWDGRVSLLAKVIPLATVGYVVSPIDLIPGDLLVPLGLGVADDIGVILLGLNLFIWVCRPEIVEEHLRALGGTLSASPPPAGEPDGDVVDGEVVGDSNR